ncbi:hypothetical protein AB9P05_12145 [Roseivirga sp. BDSF3-8]|uniref:hypothetical protein n=1 Tax=Roseivirga sp. BDSF3-8 TaxID=3241598 RepID=UPI003531AACF
MKKTLLVFLTILLAVLGFSFIHENKNEEIYLNKNASYSNAEWVVYDGHSGCGRLFRPVDTWNQFYVTKSPQDFNPIAGRQYYIIRQYFMTFGSCVTYEITS